MSSTSKNVKGFCFSGIAVDEKTTYIVNVCGHDNLEKPLAKNMTPVPEEYLDERGIDNLIIPISVCEPLKLSASDYDYCIDVMVHSSVVSRCGKAHPLVKHFISRLMELSTEWIQTEWGAVLQPKTCKLLDFKVFRPKGASTGASDPLEALKRAAEAALSAASQQAANSNVEEATQIPEPLRCVGTPHAAKETPPLIREVISNSGVQKGFLLNTKGRLYDESGSSEGEGKVFDQLSHIPESLRKRCKIINVGDMNANTVKTTPAAPAPPPPPPSMDPPKKPRWEWTLLSVDQSESHITVRLKPSDATMSLSEVDLSVTKQAIDVDHFHVDLPCMVDVDSVKAKYLKSSNVLVLTCGVLTNSA
ncbi:unnamed protein product [Phytomonas sp. Hart1]|nr:unnamed protein product [Phytomonas sp. Hart1]|eukprot:CCW71868.1 unnamed protein product [Phytomonas sp. isolate Hart1]